MGLATYKTCSFHEKRAALRTFWSCRPHESEKINQAAHEYGPYALALVAVITIELILIAALLLARANGWTWVATGTSVLALWSLWWTLQCRRHASTLASLKQF